MISYYIQCTDEYKQKNHNGYNKYMDIKDSVHTMSELEKIISNGDLIIDYTEIKEIASIIYNIEDDGSLRLQQMISGYKGMLFYMTKWVHSSKYNLCLSSKHRVSGLDYMADDIYKNDELVRNKLEEVDEVDEDILLEDILS